MGLLASKLWQPGTVTCSGLAGAPSQQSCPSVLTLLFQGHLMQTGCACAESSEVQPHPGGLSRV